MSTITVQDGALVPKDPADVKVYQFDWHTRNLAASAVIANSTWTITAIKPSTTDATLMKDQEFILAGSGAEILRKTLVRLTGGTLGQLYEISNRIVTSEDPSQTKERSFRILIQNL